MLNDLVLEVTSYSSYPDGHYRVTIRDPWDQYRTWIVHAIHSWNSHARWNGRWEIIADGPSSEYRFYGGYTSLEIARLIVALMGQCRGQEPRLIAPDHVRRRIILILNPQTRVVTGPEELVQRRSRRSAG